MKTETNKGIAPIIIVLIVAMLAGGGYGIYKLTNNRQLTTNDKIVGGDRDEHGCIGSAGYSWCEAKAKCLRVWEEKCEVATTTSAIDTKNWKTYRNEKGGFEIRYPSDWVFREYPDTKSGAGFRPASSPDEIRYEVINVNWSSRPESEKDSPFAQYVKKAAVQEIQGYESLVSLEKVVTDSGLTGYKTTWNYRGPIGGPLKLSLPITYFDTKNSNGDTVQLTLSDSKYAAIYNSALLTFKFAK